MKNALSVLVGIALFATASGAWAEDITVKMFKATGDGPGASVGSITISDSDGGASFKLSLHDLPPGNHGFQVHTNNSCGPTLMGTLRIPAGAAADHWDPDQTGKHLGPNGEGHRGDLPVILIEADGTSNQTLVAPRIKDIGDLKGHALVIHVGGDNYKDSPQPQGGGGGRAACGTID